METALKTLDQLKKELIFNTLTWFDWNKTHAAKSLGVNKKTVLNLIRLHEIEPVYTLKESNAIKKSKPELLKIKELEKKVIISRFNHFSRNRMQTATSLGLSYRGVKNLLISYGEIIRNEKTYYSRNAAERLLDDPDYTGYSEPTTKERDDWYNRNFY